MKAELVLPAPSPSPSPSPSPALSQALSPSPSPALSLASPSCAAAGEALRQQMLLQALWRRAPDSGLNGWLREDGPRAARGLQAYRANAQVLAERALASAYPTLAELIGAQDFAAMACAYWQQHPPSCGDLARHGDALAAWLADDEQLASEPYLADVARLDAMVQRCENAADGAAGLPVQGLQLLASGDADGLWLALRPGTQVLGSRWPLVSIWQAHRRDDGARFAAVRQAFAMQEAESALVFRDGWRARVEPIGARDLRFTQAVLDGLSLGAALQRAGADFSFEAWLLRAVQQQWLLAVQAMAGPGPGAATDGPAGALQAVARPRPMAA